MQNARLLMGTTTGRSMAPLRSDHRTAQAARPLRVARRRALADPGVCTARWFAGLPVAKPQRNGRTDESDRTRILVLVSGVLLFGCGFGVGAAEAQDSSTERFGLPSPLQASSAEPPYAKAEIFGGAGVVRTDTALVIRQVGANFWMARHWGAGISHWAGLGASALSVRYRLKLYDGRTELHAGASPVIFAKYRGGFEIETLPVFDVFVGRRFHRRFGVRFGLAVGTGEGAFLQPTGLAFWSFD